MTTPIDENNKREDSNEDEYKPFPVDSEEMVDNTINHTFGEPEKLIGELVSNSIDARASKIQTMLDERRLSIGVSDNGTGILNIGKFITFGGSGRKEEKKDLEPGEALIGIFGEGLKAVLKICKSMTYKSCNGEFDVYAHLRNKGKNGFDQKIEKHPLHSQRQDIGTEVVCEGIDAINFYKVKERFEGDIGEAHAWRIGSKAIQISVGTIDKNGIKNVFIVDVPTRMAGFFKDFAGQRLILNHNPRIEVYF